MKMQRKELGLYRIASALPETSPGNPGRNLTHILTRCQDARTFSPDLLVFPELSISSYSCGDLFYQDVLLKETLTAISRLEKQSVDFPFGLIVGAPLQIDASIYNCAVLVKRGAVQAVAVKTYLPNVNEFYEGRWFASARDLKKTSMRICDKEVPLGNNLIFNDDYACFGIEICEDLWAPVPPGTALALGGAEIIVNLSASNELVGKAAYRRTLVQHQSARLNCGYLYVSSGPQESTGDTVYGGHCLIAENGIIFGERAPLDSAAPQILCHDIDIGFLRHERSKSPSFAQAQSTQLNTVQRIELPKTDSIQPLQTLRRPLARTPFVPSDRLDLNERCRDILNIQSSGLATRLAHTGSRKAVIGLSGGLDSTLALLVAIDAFKKAGLDPVDIEVITMPGFGTSDRTLNNCRKLTDALGLRISTIDIKEACKLHLNNLGHSADARDTAFENIQARERTMLLMNKANICGGLVIGTGDLSELALGWCTYNGDHMSMYGVNSGVPKTLVRFLIQHVADNSQNPKLKDVLYDIIDTPISPELLPPDSSGKITQKTEDVLGPYEVHDFFLYYGIRCGFTPRKCLFLAELAFADSYSKKDLKSWCSLFYKRFFSQQFKRSCLPDGPKVGTISLSPRSDWRMPSDADGSIWQP